MKLFLAQCSLTASRLVLSAALKVSKQASVILEFLFRQCPHPGTTSPTLLHYLPDAALTSFCRALALSSAFSTALASTRIDTHLHVLPPAFAAAIDAAGGDPTGYGTPDWTLEGMMASMERTSTDIASLTGIMSASAPGVQIAGTGQAARDLARTVNEYLATSATESAYANRLGFFGVLPDWRDINGTLAEIDFLYSTQRLCNGVMVFTTYGDMLLGNPLFLPIWQKLQDYKALVFLHPDSLSVGPKFIAGGLPQLIIDFPLAPARTAVDLIMTKTLRRLPDIDIILSHAGGTLPFIASRALDLGRFYFDIALSTSAAQLHGLLDTVDADHILFGSDYPYAPAFAIDALLLQYAQFVATDERGSLIRPEKLRANSLSLLKNHALMKAFE
ncbi:2-amino-3-carboxymuconate-6-semialdehyde decarboxylase [Fusarium mexicanum]|uniref:6-methylsalicylate decarboxylase n=1 Tax=Fusarium mexicanum TaxID=751941 RepID=A0A8H5IM18_9HYPO|nr:2-amino-3-carboxymuconate-6-semialdehyde decarboxylase [Fusarium mexicanum]